MTASINKIIDSRGYNLCFCIYFSKQRFYNTKSFKKQVPNILTQQLKPSITRSLNKSRVIDLARTGANFSVEASLRHKHEYRIFDEKLLLDNEEHYIFEDLAILGYLL